MLCSPSWKGKLTPSFCADRMWDPAFWKEEPGLVKSCESAQQNKELPSRPVGCFDTSGLKVGNLRRMLGHATLSSWRMRLRQWHLHPPGLQKPSSSSPLNETDPLLKWKLLGYEPLPSSAPTETFSAWAISPSLLCLRGGEIEIRCEFPRSRGVRIRSAESQGGPQGDFFSCPPPATATVTPSTHHGRGHKLR